MRRSPIALLLAACAWSFGCQRPPAPVSPSLEEPAPPEEPPPSNAIGERPAPSPSFSEAVQRYAEAVRALDDRPHEESEEDIGRIFLVLADAIELVPDADDLAPADVAEELRSTSARLGANPPPEQRPLIEARALARVRDFLKRAADRPYEAWPRVAARVRELSLAIATLGTPRPMPLEREDVIDTLHVVEDVLRAIEEARVP